MVTYAALIFHFQSVWLLPSYLSALHCLRRLLMFQPFHPNNRKEGLSYLKNLPQHFCLYLLGSDWVTWPPWLQVKLENVVFQLRTVTTFRHILSKLDGVHFCAQMERTERSSSMGEQCVIRSSMGSDSKMLNSKEPCETIVTQVFK